MYTLAQPQAILKCKCCHVSFIPEPGARAQKTCYNCKTLNEVKMRVRARK